MSVDLSAVLADIDDMARSYSAVGYAHEGDCAGTFCPACGHCVHSIETCDHECGENGGGCADAVDDDEVILKRHTVALVSALRAVLAEHKRATAYGVAVCDTCSQVKDADEWDDPNDSPIASWLPWPCPTVKAIAAHLDTP